VSNTKIICGTNSNGNNGINAGGNLTLDNVEISNCPNSAVYIEPYPSESNEVILTVCSPSLSSLSSRSIK
jgi:hypothetical protein